MRILGIFLVFLLSSTGRAEATEAETKGQNLSNAALPAPVEAENEKLLRIGGTYKVVKLQKRADSEFEIHFESAPPSGRYDRLVLHSDHIHMGLQEGQTLRLSAEVLKSSADELEVTQVLLFLSNPEYGTTPVWMLSSQHASGQELRASRWLDMHAPQADYIIL